MITMQFLFADDTVIFSLSHETETSHSPITLSHSVMNPLRS